MKKIKVRAQGINTDVLMSRNNSNSFNLIGAI